MAIAPKIILALEKYSDWLEAFSALHDAPPSELTCFFIANDRNDHASVKGLFSESLDCGHHCQIVAVESKDLFFKRLFATAKALDPGDIFVAPFIRYRPLWLLATQLRPGVKTVHLSECLPDSFGHIGYRLGFRGNDPKAWLTLPLAKWFAMKNKLHVCYFPLAPQLNNPFTKISLPVIRPVLSRSKAAKIEALFQGRPRALLVDGFGYDATKMAAALDLSEYIATSKGCEIIVDGVIHPLTERICAEEVLLSGLVPRVVSYTSSAVIWAKILCPAIEIECYHAPGLDRRFGFLFSRFAISSLKRVGIPVRPADPQMQNHET